MNSIPCVLCSTLVNSVDSHNAYPLAEGRCCKSCNEKVILARLKKIYKNPLKLHTKV